MRISDWSSDVCSSDLPPPTAIFASNDDMAAAAVAVAHRRGVDVPGDLSICGFDDTPFATTIWPALTTIHQPIADMSRAARSEEHTSEFQSIMRSSYAVFCLKKKHA